jgi:hypothetical protein
VWIYDMELSATEELRRRLEERCVPSFLDFETAIKALGVAARYREIRGQMERD